MTNQTEQGTVPPNIASTAPDHIWLDIGEQAHLIDPGDTFKTLAGDVTWSGDNATGCGIKYIRADLANSTPEGYTSVPAGYALVPLEPTDAMVAARNALVLSAPSDDPPTFVEVYRVMVAAATAKDAKP